MAIEYWQLICGLLVALLLLTHGQAQYWRARAKTIKEEFSTEGWQEECEYWRNLFKDVLIKKEPK